MDSDGVLNSMYGRDAEDGRVIGGRGHIIIKKRSSRATALYVG